MLDFGALPPEVNSGRMYTGPGSGPMMAAASAWDALASQLETVSRGYAAVILGLQGENWSGSASAAMADAAAPYVEWLTLAGAKAEEAASQARAAAAAYETALAATVPPPLVAANRVQYSTLVATNIFGQNTSQIAANEAAYAEMWAQDVHAMYGYAASASASTALTQFSEPPPTTNGAGQTMQAAAVAQAVGGGAASQSQSTLSQLMAAVPQQLQTLASGASTNASATGSSTPVLSGFAAFNTLSGPANFAGALSRTVTSGGSFASGLYRAALQSAGDLPKVATPALPASAVTGGAAGRTVLASVGRAEPIGGLSAPPSWASATPVASAVEEPHWMSEMDLGAVSSEEAGAASASGAAPIAGMGPMAGMAARSSVSSVLRVAPRQFKMPRPAIGG